MRGLCLVPVYLVLSCFAVILCLGGLLTSEEEMKEWIWGRREEGGVDRAENGQDVLCERRIYFQLKKERILKQWSADQALSTGSEGLWPGPSG